jgi:asparagine synthase (glutamine-hydrolysing)
VPDPGRIRNAVQSLAHRGPDRQAVFESGLVSLGAARLKIIDLATGDQPMTAGDGGTVIVFNGEIYNHAQLRAELERRGHAFHSHTDTETVLRAFLEWDVECFSRLRGMFALGIWNESQRRLVLARDRMGIKPLYIARRGDEIYFGSELKTIFVHPEIERRLDPAGLDCWLSLNYVPAPRTLVEGIEKLRPGHWLEWRCGEVRSEAYWQLPFGSPAAIGLNEATQRLDALLESAVGEHMLSDVPLGLWLSGGIDSSTILHYAAAQSSSPLRTFSISFRGHSFDETDNIARLVAQYGTRHEQLDLNTNLNLRDAIEQFANYADEPNGDAGAVPVWFLSQLTRRTATVALSGEGADELFGGYETYRANTLARRMRRLPAPILKLAAAAARLWPVSDDKISFEYKLKRFLAGCRMRPEQAHVFWNGTFSDQQKRGLVAEQLPGAMAEILEELSRAGDHTAAYLWFDQKNYLPDDILAKVDRMSMAHSVEIRPPFLDHRIAEFAATLPERLKIRGSRLKVVLRSLMKDRLPPSVLAHGKIGFDIPAHEWLRGPLRPLLEETLSEGTANHPGLFQRGAVDSYLQDHLARHANLGYHLWGLMILFLWMKRWKIQTNAAPVADLELTAPVSPGTWPS